MSSIIEVNNLSKSFTISHEGTKENYTALRDVMVEKAKKLFSFSRPQSVVSREDFWALKDVSFNIQQGDRVGIIGRNGAGKSTLLKILSRITEPTKGNIKIRGRVASLLEVGTGFHPELTGRENIFLNGAILGMSRAEIKQKFDEIVDFSGVEKFLDTPVKRYSSGMYVRLAFAVAAHLEPEILIIDEVLAVGDAEFQKKCLGKMEDVSKNEGRTVLFVSHNLQAISSLTNKLILLNQGQKVFDGDTNNGIKEYLSYMNSHELVYIKEPDSEKPVVIKAAIKSSDLNNVHAFGKPFTIDFEVSAPVGISSAVFSFQIVNTAQVKVLHVLIKDSETPLCREKGIHKFSCHFPQLRLYPDKYTLILHLSDHITKYKYETIEGVCPFEVQIRGEVREYYWKPNEAVYIDESQWIIQ
jgi:lipopolysaccharide transport system ATP-binding protein